MLLPPLPPPPGDDSLSLSLSLPLTPFPQGSLGHSFPQFRDALSSTAWSPLFFEMTPSPARPPPPPPQPPKAPSIIFSLISLTLSLVHLLVPTFLVGSLLIHCTATTNGWVPQASWLQRRDTEQSLYNTVLLGSTAVAAC